MTTLPPTGMHHSLAAGLFALRCLTYALLHPPRKVR